MRHIALFGCISFLLFAFLFLVPVNALELEGYTSDNALLSGRVKRAYDLFVPNPNSQEKRPLVIVLHGHLGSAKKVMNKNNPNRSWLDVAQREDFIVAIPNGLVGPDGFTSWNDCRKDNTTNTNADDLGFLKQLIQALVREQNVDPSRVYLTGTSNGGHLSLRAALEAPELIAAVAPVAASMPESSKCSPAKQSVPVLFINGTHDPILPYRGGEMRKKSKKRKTGTVISVEDSVGWWVKYNRSGRRPIVSQLSDLDPKDKSHAIKYYYAGVAPVVLIKVSGGGHTEPSLTRHYRAFYRWIVGGQNRDFETAEEIWSFFKDHER